MSCLDKGARLAFKPLINRQLLLSNYAFACFGVSHGWAMQSTGPQSMPSCDMPAGSKRLKQMLHGIKGRAEAASILSDQGLTSLLHSLASTLPPLTSTSELMLSAGACVEHAVTRLPHCTSGA